MSNNLRVKVLLRNYKKPCRRWRVSYLTFMSKLMAEARHLTEDGFCRLCNGGANEDTETHSILHIGENKYMEAKKKGR